MEIPNTLTLMHTLYYISNAYILQMVRAYPVRYT